jgi:hypothetical protein
MSHTIQINRAPVLTLWAAVVAERLGYDRPAALTLGRAVAGLNAQAKGRRLHLFEPPTGAKKRASPTSRRRPSVTLLGREVPVTRGRAGVRAVSGDVPGNPAAVERYLSQNFGPALGDARAAMERLARAYSADELAERAYGLYEEFRPAIPAGARGWGAKGALDLDRIRRLAEDAASA